MRKNTLLPLAAAMMLACGDASYAYFETNPYANAKGYINSDYTKQVDNFFARYPSYKEKSAKLGLLDTKGNWDISTAVWLDNRAAIEGDKNKGTHGMLFHLNEALKQAVENKTSVVITFVIYDLPIRDCDAFSSNGEFTKPEDLDLYKSNYIDKIKKMMDDFYQQPNSENVRTVFIIEPDSLPNLITNANKERCQIAASKNIYVDGVKYALTEFSKNFNNNPKAKIAMYIDIAHSGWLGWAENMNKIADIYNRDKLGQGFDNIRGFITNTANYTPVQETFTYEQYLPNYQNPKLSNWIMQSKYYEWNETYDESSYVAAIASLQNDGQLKQLSNHRILPVTQTKFANLHFLIDTSRNGWMVNVADYQVPNHENKLVNYARKDQRHHRGNWCNIQAVNPRVTDIDNVDKKPIPTIATSAGLGELPQVNPKVVNPLYKDEKDKDLLLPIDAYVWVKPPGESDGYYDANNNLGDQMCGNEDGGSHNARQATDALQDGSAHAPKAGYFFDQAFKNLIDVRGCIDKKFTSGFCS